MTHNVSTKYDYQNRRLRTITRFDQMPPHTVPAKVPHSAVDELSQGLADTVSQVMRFYMAEIPVSEFREELYTWLYEHLNDYTPEVT